MNTDKTQIMKVAEFQKVTTGSAECDQLINRAVDVALLRVKPILRDFLREELKRLLEACDE